ncbi:unnamed protein product [Triticum turgidum subsp. durum]|uniref:Thioredoxin domain-containing protein n=1 Tax=Triticum turgidum subsp. durum TaxID=4567 RepID=A0A9R0Q1F8_TRITD|nr:unnamed protein product [Triticum turgidum subsp. durum]
MAEALLHHLPRRFGASTTASSSPSSHGVLSPAPRADLRVTRLAAAAPPGRPHRLMAHAAVRSETGEQPKWWEKNAGANMIDIHSTQEFLDALRDAGDRLVIVEFYGTWCGSCRALFPRFYRGADGQLEAFSCSLAKFQKLKDAIAVHNTDRCSIGPPVGVGDVLASSSSQEKPAEAAS